MKINNFFYNVGQGFKGIFRNSVMTTASVLVLVACMILVGTLYLVIDTIDRNFKAIDGLNVIEAMVSKSYSEDQVESIRKDLEKIKEDSPIIEKDVVFISADEHLEKMLEEYDEDWIRAIFDFDKSEDEAWEKESEGNYDLDDYNSGVQDNPLRASFRIEFINLSDTDEVRRVKNKIDSITVKDGAGAEFDAFATEDIKDYIDLYANVMSIKNTLYIAGIWLMAIFLLISLFVIMNTIKLGVFARRNEITFMRLCGATKSFIRMPFLVEGVIIGIFSSAVAFGIEYYLYAYLFKDLVASAADSASGSGIIFAPFGDYAFLLAAGFLAIGLFAGIISSSISLKKYLKA